MYIETGGLDNLTVRATYMNKNGIIRETFDGFLVPGKRYRVIKSFLDATKKLHSEGEEWKYLGFCPNGFSESTYIYISTEESDDSAFAIDWNSSENNLGIENVNNYVQEI